MKFVLMKNLEELSQGFMQQMLIPMYANKSRVNIAVTTGTTPEKGYALLADFVKGKDCFDTVHYYIFDEFWYRDDSIGICRRELNKYYFDRLHIPEERIHNLREDNWQNTDAQIEADGGLDMVIMGIGTNGHFCGNQPHTFTNWNEGTHRINRHASKDVEALMLELLHVDLGSTEEERIPDHYITMGPKTIMQAKKIVFLLSGEKKASVAAQAFFGPITYDFPVSIFQLHPDVTVLLDEAAASQIRDRL